MDRFEAMSTFVAVAEAEGFTAAARKLGTPLATLSRQVSQLEERLGVRLLTRTSRRVTLTEEGRRYLASCRRLLGDLVEAESNVIGEKGSIRGELTITAPILFGRLHLLPIVNEFLRQHGDLAVRLLFVDRVINLLEENVDLAIRIAELPDSGLVAIRLGEIGTTICASPAYLAQRGRPESVADLDRHDCLTFLRRGSYEPWRLQVDGTTRLVTVRSRLFLTTAEAAVDAAIAGMGLTQVLDYQAAPAIAEGRLVAVLADCQPEPTPLSLVHPGGRLVPRRLRAFLDLAAPRLRARFAQEVAAG